jgi:hypothetical protein
LKTFSLSSRLSDYCRIKHFSFIRYFRGDLSKCEGFIPDCPRNCPKNDGSIPEYARKGNLRVIYIDYRWTRRDKN